MNLHAVAAGAIGAVNPMINATWRRSNGYTADASGRQIPAYLADTTASVQRQALSGRELAHANDLNIQGVLSTLILNGSARATSRSEQTGGDLFVIGAETWLVVQVLETWPDWSRVVVCLQ